MCTRHDAGRPVGWLLLASVLWTVPLAAQGSGAFQPVPTPNPHATTNALQSVAAAATDAWALGSSGASPTVPLLLHWDGADWAPRPMPTGPAGVTYSVLGSTPDGDIWLGGEGARPLPGTPGTPVLARAREGAFDRVDEVTLPPQTEYPHWQRGGTPMAIDGTSASDVWVALEASGNGDATGTIIPSVLHFDGDAWTETQLPRRSTLRSHPRGIDALAPDDVWMVGYGRSVGTAFFGEVYHYDGTSWSYVPTPLETTGQVFFLDVSASGPDDVWVVGHLNYTDPVYLHWDGSAWAHVPGPPTTTAPPAQVVALSPTDAWALPYVLSGSTSVFHWDGATWTEVDGTIAGATDVTRVDLARAGSHDEAWSVGSYDSNGVRRTLAERVTPKAVAAETAPAGGPWSVVVSPNPTAGSTRIRYTLPTAAAVRVEVFDRLGRRIAVLMEGEQPAGGHGVTWDASGLPAGVYLIRLLGSERIWVQPVTRHR